MLEELGVGRPLSRLFAKTGLIDPQEDHVGQQLSPSRTEG
jgi:hypothetical protein